MTINIKCLQLQKHLYTHLWQLQIQYGSRVFFPLKLIEIKIFSWCNEILDAAAAFLFARYHIHITCSYEKWCNINYHKSAYGKWFDNSASWLNAHSTSRAQLHHFESIWNESWDVAFRIKGSIDKIKQQQQQNSSKNVQWHLYVSEVLNEFQNKTTDRATEREKEKKTNCYWYRSLCHVKLYDFDMTFQIMKTM